MGEHSSLSRCETSDESLQQVGEDRSDRSAGFADEVDDEVADEEAARLGFGRLEELGDLCEDELETRLAGCASPVVRTKNRVSGLRRDSR